MAQAMARPMPVEGNKLVLPGIKDSQYVPVFPEVGSMTTLLPGISFPSFSAASTMAFAIRSFTDPPADVNSTFATGHNAVR